MTSSAMCLCSYRALSQAGLLLPTPTWSKINITVAARGSGRYSAPFCQQSSVSVASFLLFPQCCSFVRPHVPLFVFLHRPVWAPARLILPLIHLSLHLSAHHFGSLCLAVVAPSLKSMQPLFWLAKKDRHCINTVLFFQFSDMIIFNWTLKHSPFQEISWHSRMVHWNMIIMRRLSSITAITLMWSPILWMIAMVKRFEWD